jgi:cyclopropane-fatty-acyl-phospholipid synthase
MWGALLDRMIRSFLRQGALAVRFPDGTLRRYGVGDGVTITINDEATVRRLVLDPQLAVGEAYMDGTLVIDGDDLHGFLEALVPNTALMDAAAWYRLRQTAGRLVAPLRQLNGLRKSLLNVSHHYDLTPAIYDLFLDADKQYSCAYFRDPANSLEQAQIDKKDHIARKLRIVPGMTVLDIGCGWGGLGITMARDYGARVVGVTLSREQLAIAKRRVETAGLSGQVDFRLQDYRHVTEVFDRVVSVGMFEHVGLPNYATYFQTVHDRLDTDGVALIHTIGHPGRPAPTSPWIDRHIFPGGYIPSLSEVAPAIERSGLRPMDIECWRLHYALTLRHWYDRFTARAAEAADIHDERFVRMWKFYLAGSEAAFRWGRQDVWQFQLAKKVDAVPITRDYLYGLTPRAAAGQEAAA